MSRIFIAQKNLNHKLSLVIPFGKYEPLEYSIETTSSNIAVIRTNIILDSDKEYQIIPCFSSTFDASYGYQVAAHSIEDASNDVTEKIKLAPIGKYVNKGERNNYQEDKYIKSDIDNYIVKDLNLVEIQFRLNAYDVEKLLDTFWLLTICLFIKGVVVCSNAGQVRTVEPLAVPMKSQMVEPDDIRRRICSPASVSMVIDYFGSNSSVVEIARLAYNKLYNMYGLWPASIWSASKYGVLGYIYRFSNWREVIWLLEKSIPVIATINYGAGELIDAAIEQTPGHLVVVKGISGDSVIVNDPAAPDEKSVERQYDIKQFTKHWFGKKGVGYVLFSNK